MDTGRYAAAGATIRCEGTEHSLQYSIRASSLLVEDPIEQDVLSLGERGSAVDARLEVSPRGRAAVSESLGYVSSR